VPVLLTEGTSGKGVDELVESLAAHADSGATPQRRGGRGEWQEVLREEILLRLERGIEAAEGALAAEVERGEKDPYAAALEILDDADRVGKLLDKGARRS